MLGIRKKGVKRNQEMPFCHCINPWYTHTLNTACSFGLPHLKKNTVKLKEFPSEKKLNRLGLFRLEKKWLGRGLQ